MSKVKKMTLCALFTALIAIGAFIQIPVPYMDYFTLQFLFVLLAGLLLGGRLGALSVCVYVLIGLVGIPIFAAGGGLSYVARPTFGYLIGFIAAAFVTGSLSKTEKPSFIRDFLACLAGFAVTYAIGLLYKYLMLNVALNTPTSFWIVFASCFPLDMPGDFVLCIFAAVLARYLKKPIYKVLH